MEVFHDLSQDRVFAQWDYQNLQKNKAKQANKLSKAILLMTDERRDTDGHTTGPAVQP